jgi:hypothetical protein
MIIDEDGGIREEQVGVLRAQVACDEPCRLVARTEHLRKVDHGGDRYPRHHAGGQTPEVA